MKTIAISITTIILFAIAGFPTPAETPASFGAISAIPLPTPEKRLDAGAVEALLDELLEGLSSQIDDAEVIADIGDKWNSRKNLAGKTRTQILDVLIVDVRAIVDDKETEDSIWASWNDADADDPELWIKFVHHGMYMADFDVSWSEPGKPNNTTRGEAKVNGYEQLFAFPSDATNIRVRISNHTGLVWEPKRNIINRPLRSTEINKCLIIEGTTLKATMKFEPC